MNGFDPAALAGYFRVKETVVQLSATVIVAVPANPARVALLFATSSAGSATYISTMPALTTSTGIPLGPGTQLSFAWREWGSLPGLTWYALGAFGMQTMTILEVVYQPPGE